MERGDKNKLILLVAIFTLLALNLFLVSAQVNQFDQGFTDVFNSWVKGEAIDEIGIKLIFLLFIFIILMSLLSFSGINMGISFLLGLLASFLITWFITPDSILGVLKTNDVAPLVILMFLELFILFGFTFLALKKSSATLINTQFFIWWAYFIIRVIHLGLVTGILYLNPTNFGFEVPSSGTSGAFWFWASLWVKIIVSGIMAIGNGIMLRVASNIAQGNLNLIAQTNVQQAGRGFQALRGFGNQALGA